MVNSENQSAVENEIAFLSKKIIELNKQLIESEKTKSRFLSLVTSELNNPMTVLMGMVPHLEVHICDESKKIYPTLNQEVLNLDFKIKNILMAAKIESGKFDATNSSVDPIEVINEVIETLKYIIEERKIHLHVNNQINKRIVADPEILYTIARNLISNAALYADEGSAVEININKKEHIFTITVKNIGELPEMMYKPQIFTRFFDGPNSEHGLGLGLSIVRALCEMFEGNVDYTSENRNVIFTASLFLNESQIDSQAYGSNEFLFESFDDAIEM